MEDFFFSTFALQMWSTVSAIFLFQILHSFQMYIWADFLVFLAVKQEDEPAEGGQGEAVPEKTDETDDEKKIKKVMKLFKR